MQRTYTNILLIILLTTFGLLQSNAQKIYTTQRIVGKKPTINGIIDEEVWNQGKWASGFGQQDPHNGGPASQKTEFKILYDENNLYIAVKAYDDEPEKIQKRMSRRDSWDGDLVGFNFDSYHDKRTSFYFSVNAGGVKNDAVQINDAQNFDKTWDPIWFAKTSLTEYGWSAEMKIPLSQLRFDDKEEQIWGMAVARSIFRLQEMDFWEVIPDDAAGFTSLFSELHGLSNIKPKRQVEIAPYVMTKLDLHEKEEGNPYRTGRDLGMDAGLDGKIGITNNLTLDFAINPDFGQVEADPSEVNLSAFESYFSEKRLFFIEGSNITNYQLTPGGSPWARDNLFYSRRIGRSPQGNPDYLYGQEYVDQPQSTRILGALKLTGKTKDGWSIGILESVTNNEKAKINNNGDVRKETVEPLTNYFLGRLQKDMYKGNTIIGGMITSTYRDLQDDYLSSFLVNSALSGGLDFMQFFQKKKYYLKATLSASHIVGSESAIQEQQLSSRRYFQRPDADYLHYDSTRTSLSGHAGTIAFGKDANTGLRYSFNATWRSPGYEINDMGYLRKANTLFQSFWIGYSITKPFSIFRNMRINANEWAGWDFGGINTFKGGNISFNTSFKNLWSFNSSISIEGENVDNTALRGGPALYYPGHYNYNLGFGSNSTKKLSIHTGYWDNIGIGIDNRTYGMYGALSYRPQNTLSFSFSASYNFSGNQLQYVSQIPYGTETRYIFSNINQKTLNLALRVNYIITPDLSIQYYGSPFVSSGLYSNYKHITDPKAATFEDRIHIYQGQEIVNMGGYYDIYENDPSQLDYSFGDPNFNFRQYRSNLVLRWEYLPGSLFYLVWSQGKTSYISEGDFHFTNDLKELFGEYGQNVFLIKLSYRIRA